MERNSMLIKKIIILLLVISNLNVIAQEKKHEINLLTGGGVSIVDCFLSSGKRRIESPGGHFGLGYTFYFHKYWSLNSGLEYTYYTSVIRDYWEIFSSTQDVYIQNTLYKFRAWSDEYVEYQTATYLNIPVMAQFQVGDKHKLSIMAGAKIGIPLKASYDSYIDNLATDMTNAAGVTSNKQNYPVREHAKGDLDMGIALSLSGEISARWKLTDKTALSFGGYIDYGINNIYKGEKGKPLFPYNPDGKPRNNPIYASQYSNNGIQTAYSDKVSLFAMGVKLRLSFDISKQSKE